MRLPQLVREIIDYYIYFRQWKAKIRQLNEEYEAVCEPFQDGIKIRREHGFFAFTYGMRLMDLSSLNNQGNYIYRYNFRRGTIRRIGVLPDRYVYSNTKRQLKSLFLFLSPDY